MIPSRQTLRRVNGLAPSDLDVAGVDLIFHLMSAVEVIRNSVYTRLHKEAGLSEGKFSLMMSLRDAGHPVSTGRLAAHLGVSDATVSVMVKRMLAEETPLIARYADPEDRRGLRLRQFAGDDAFHSLAAHNGQRFPAQFATVSHGSCLAELAVMRPCPLTAGRTFSFGSRALWD